MRDPRISRRAPRGFSLLDCLVYIGLLALLLTLAFMAFYTVTDHSRHLSANAADIARALNAGERWRKDVRSAIEAPQLVRTADDTVLHLPQPVGEIQYVHREGMVYRFATARTNEGWQIFLAGVKISTMRPKKYSEVSAWQWSIELEAKQKAARVKPLFTFQAVLASNPTL